MSRFLFCVILTLSFACVAKEPTSFVPNRPTRSASVEDKDFVSPSMRKTTVFLPSDDAVKIHTVAVEVAETEMTRQRGLMWREQLKDGDGMLFIFGSEAVQRFWMKNTLISLDMIFVDEKFYIVGAVQNAEPKTLTSRSVEKPAKYVIEVPAGYVAKYKIKTGARVRIDGVSN